MLTQNLPQSIVEQVGCRMVGGRGLALVRIHTSHKLSRRILRQLLDDVDRLVVLTLGVDDLDGLSLVAEDTTVTYLTTHLAIEGGIIEHELIELILLLRHLTITEDMTIVFRIVVAHELLLTLGKFHPV